LLLLHVTFLKVSKTHFSCLGMCFYCSFKHRATWILQFSHLVILQMSWY
jgi:hypothetical protein